MKGLDEIRRDNAKPKNRDEDLASVRLVRLTRGDHAALEQAIEDVARMQTLDDDARPSVAKKRDRALLVVRRLISGDK